MYSVIWLMGNKATDIKTAPFLLLSSRSSSLLCTLQTLLCHLSVAGSGVLQSAHGSFSLLLPSSHILVCCDVGSPWQHHLWEHPVAAVHRPASLWICLTQKTPAVWVDLKCHIWAVMVGSTTAELLWSQAGAWACCAAPTGLPSVVLHFSRVHR